MTPSVAAGVVDHHEAACIRGEEGDQLGFGPFPSHPISVSCHIGQLFPSGRVNHDNHQHRSKPVHQKCNGEGRCR
jgi:hypothetical protein